MGKKRISSADLSWIISEEFDRGKHQTRASLAVVPDDKEGWRVIVGNRARRSLMTVDEQRLAEIQHRLRMVYELQR